MSGGHGRIRLTPRSLPGLDAPAFSLHAAPALISLLAAHGAFGAKPDIVLSGVNRGANVGRAILHSGTVGAAVTGGVNGARGFAISLATGDGLEEPQWTTAGTVVGWLLPLLIDSPEGTVFNVNVPNVPHASGLEVIEAPLAPFGIVHTTMTERDEDLVSLAIADPITEYGPGTDAAVLAGGSVTITSIRSVGEADLPAFPVDGGRSRQP